MKVTRNTLILECIHAIAMYGADSQAAQFWSDAIVAWDLAHTT